MQGVAGTAPYVVPEHRSTRAVGPARVLCLHTATLPPLGADTWIHAQIIKNLDPGMVEVEVACVKERDGAPTPTYSVLSQIRGVRIRPTNLGPELYLRSARARLAALWDTLPALSSLGGLVRHVRRNEIQIIHTSDRPRDALAAVIVARATGAKAVIHVHVGYGEWMSPLLRWSLKRADVLVAVSEFVAGTLRDSGHRADRIHVVRNAIDSERWIPGVGRAEVREEFGIRESAPVLLTVCRLFPAKGPAELLRALALVKRDFPDVHLLIAGEDITPQRSFTSELNVLMKELELEDSVTFTGRRGDIPRLMAAADVYAMPSFGEPFGLVFAEAMAMGLPVVGLNNGGTPEVVEHGVSGLLSDPGDIATLAKNLKKLLRDPDLRRRMGEAGQQRVADHFIAERMARDMERIYALASA